MVDELLSLYQYSDNYVKQAKRESITKETISADISRCRFGDMAQRAGPVLCADLVGLPG